MTIDITRQMKQPMDDSFRPSAGDGRYPGMLGDKPFNDERNNYYYLSKYYQKTDTDAYAGTFAETRAANNLRDFGKSASFGSNVPVDALTGGALGYMVGKHLLPGIADAYLSAQHPIKGMIGRAGLKYHPTYSHLMEHLPRTSAVAGAALFGTMGMLRNLNRSRYYNGVNYDQGQI